MRHRQVLFINFEKSGRAMEYMLIIMELYERRNLFHISERKIEHR